MTRRARAGASAIVATALASIVAPAGAADPTKERCVAANADAQALRIDGKLAAAREQLDLCVAQSCPTIVREDCATRLDELDRAQPTIVFDVKDATGNDLVAVSVTVDGKPLVDRLEGKALKADPGEHIFLFQAPGRPVVSRRFVLKEGEKNRRERVVIGRPSVVGDHEAGTGSAVWATPHYSSEVESAPLGAQRILGFTIGGIGLGGLAAGTVFGLLTFNAVNAQKSDCSSATSCPNYQHALTDHSTATQDAQISTILFAVGGGLAALGELLLFTAPKREVTPTAGVRWLPSVAPGGGALSMQGGF
jgi:hypothetical protein